VPGEQKGADGDHRGSRTPGHRRGGGRPCPQYPPCGGAPLTPAPFAARRTQLDASVLGLTFEALVFVTMRYADRQTVAAFEEHVADIPNVLQAQRLFGDPDYLLRVVARDLPAYRQLYDERLATLPGILRLSSTLVMKSVVDARPLPL
jgi:DNA-binding Lrp family transcriptional regulator